MMVAICSACIYKPKLLSYLLSVLHRSIVRRRPTEVTCPSFIFLANFLLYYSYDGLARDQRLPPTICSTLAMHEIAICHVKLIITVLPLERESQEHSESKSRSTNGHSFFLSLNNWSKPVITEAAIWTGNPSILLRIIESWIHIKVVMVELC